jgi:transcriptional regulator GlxA family with amidase domain
MEQQDRNDYTLHTVSLDGGPILTTEGVTIETAPISKSDTAEIDTIVIPGALDMEPALADRRLLEWLVSRTPGNRPT